MALCGNVVGVWPQCATTYHPEKSPNPAVFFFFFSFAFVYSGRASTASGRGAEELDFLVAFRYFKTPLPDGLTAGAGFENHFLSSVSRSESSGSAEKEEIVSIKARKHDTGAGGKGNDIESDAIAKYNIQNKQTQ